MLSPLVLSGAHLGNVLPRIREDGLPGAHYHGISTEYAVCQLSFRGAILASKRSLTLTPDILMRRACNLLAFLCGIPFEIGFR